MLLSAKPFGHEETGDFGGVWPAPEPRYWMSCKVQ
jgi:hypothetical protein